ncbi:MAG: DUF4364 family protein [Candidatus Fimousia sp.]|uniref:DUF4364 family protein n=1 Tax=Anaerostipes sp. 992a TaxID=1261637 RepID=UPI00095357D2|nr:DUF4364 family protein [Anaerostipes sp. 992a]MDD5968314.1 DUF4364 family protein [Anaerostipes sp.]OLR66093.1 hypothetical protein BHF69_01495 [Anaerostipes sp. 992a]
MQKDAATLYKLIVLYMLYKVDFPLTNSQISEFILDQGYTNYFSLQTAINELIESDMIRVENIRNSSLYHLEAAGVEAIEMFEDRISDGIKQDIMTYFENNKYHLRNEVEITADYYPSKKEEYFVDCKIKEKGNVLLELKLNVLSKEQAIAICDDWHKDSSDVYSYLVEKLMLK